MSIASPITENFWKNIQITNKDIEFLHNHLFELETPLTIHELAAVLIAERAHQEHASVHAERTSNAKTYLPKETYREGDEIAFPALDWKKGKVIAIRPGLNPVVGSFDVLTVLMDTESERMFAARLEHHALNTVPVVDNKDESLEIDAVLKNFGSEIEHKIETVFMSDDGLVRIAGRWFPRSLLIDVNLGHLNLAEAVLDMAAGEPLAASKLLADIALPGGDNKLAEFSLNYALQEDPRFDEVGPAGQVLWCLLRLEPDGVKDVPLHLRYQDIPHDRSVLDPQMLALESQQDDELSPVSDAALHADVSSVTISLIYPHLRAGTLPISARAMKLFPTAYESPRVRFTLVDGKTNQKIPAWVVRESGYVFGLREWYKSQQLMPGSLVQVKRGRQPGEVIVEAKTQRASKDWVRTLLVGADGGLVFAMLKQAITAEFNDRMAVYVPDFKSLDPLWEKQRSFEDVVISVMREVTKMNPQGHIHAQELYAAVNLVRRVPPAPLFTLLSTRPIFKHVGDLHFRLDMDAE